MKKYISIVLLQISVWLGVEAVQAGIFDQLQFTKIATNLRFAESPVWHPDGYLLFSDVEAGQLYKWTPTGGAQVWIDPSGNANGLAVSRRNELYVCKQGSRELARIDSLGRTTTLVTQWNGMRLNSPNDVVLSYLGSAYFTDPDFGTIDRALSFQGLFCLPYNSNTPVLLDSTLVKPNGLCFNYDWKTLYVCESSSNTIYTYTLKNESTVDLSKDKKVFVKVNTTDEIDGICSDWQGNIYVACGTDGLRVYSATAVLLATIRFAAGEKVRNLCLGGIYENELYVAAGNSVYRTTVRFDGDFVAPGLLGVPTDRSVQFSSVSDLAMEAYITYGTDSLLPNLRTATVVASAGQPIELTLTDMQPGAFYYYQLYYKVSGTSGFKPGTCGSFRCQRRPGEAFRFAVEADPHLDENSNEMTFRHTLQNELQGHPDFLIDLGR